MRLLYPPVWVLLVPVPLSFAALAFLFATGNDGSVVAYAVYGMSAYALTVWIAAMPRLLRRLRAAFARSRPVLAFRRSRFGESYLHEPAFRGRIGIYQGMAVNYFYAGFRLIAGIRYGSVWFLSVAAYYLALGGLRTYLALCASRRDPEAERRCYRRTARLLFLLNLPMGGMIFLTVRTDSGFLYPGYIIYVSALFTFYTATLSVVNFVKFRRLGSPVLSAAKTLNLVSAMMSVLGLQTAMISSFSENGEGYRQMMNAITGGFIYGAVILIAVWMLRHSKKSEKRVTEVEQIGEQILCNRRKNG